MMRLPKFRYLAPRELGEVVRVLRGEGPKAMLLAGGTDLFPNMKRRHQTPAVLVSLRNVPGLSSRKAKGKGVSFGPMTTLAEIAGDRYARETFPALARACHVVATPQIRNMATLGGNLCLDTRCNYYDQSYEWRKSIDFCMKKDGKICWVAPSSPRCWAVSSTDTAPALIALGASVVLRSSRGVRKIDLEDLYSDDGIRYLTRKPGEILTAIELVSEPNWKSTYWKLRRRGSFDFPVLSVAAALRVHKGVIEKARIALGAVASRPLLAREGSEFLEGKRYTDDVIAEAAERISVLAKPLDNTDFELSWRKKMVAKFVVGALQELRGEPVRDLKLREGRVPLPMAVA